MTEKSQKRAGRNGNAYAEAGSGPEGRPFLGWIEETQNDHGKKGEKRGREEDKFKSREIAERQEVLKQNVLLLYVGFEWNFHRAQRSRWSERSS
jgi:hypothetical protein